MALFTIHRSFNPRRSRDRQRGSAMVESALTMVLYFMIVFGIVGFGRAMWAYTFVSHAAREATRWASVRGSQSASPVSTAAPIDTYIRNNDMMGLDPADMPTITASWAASNDPGDTVTVTVTYNATKLVPFIPAIMVSSTSKMVIAQ
jgi:Flp pilus assembly protein TadG